MPDAGFGGPMGHHADVAGQPRLCAAAPARGRVVLTVALAAMGPGGRATPAQMMRLRDVLAASPMVVDIPHFALADLIRGAAADLARLGRARVLADLVGRPADGLAEAGLALALRASLCGGRLPAAAAWAIADVANRIEADLDAVADVLAALRMLDAA